jgi:Ser/Thr protein kinase RdoA (MazF antagonist)
MTVSFDTMTPFEQAPSDVQLERLRRLACAALGAWSLEDARVEPIKYRENAVFSVDAGDDGRYVMRVHRPDYRTDVHILSEFAWAAALAEADVLTPEPVAARDGKLVCSAEADGVPQARQCDLLRWIDGRPIGTIEEGVVASDDDAAETYRRLGEMAATVHTHAAGWSKPDWFERPPWDAAALVGENPTFGKFWELDCLSAPQLDVLLTARDEAHARLQAFGTGADRYGLIHGDFLPENVYCTADGTRLLDFDDCGDSWYVFELATSIYFLRGQANYALIRDAFVEGYRTRRALPDEQLAMLPTMLMARGLSYLGWPAGRREIEAAREIAPLLAEDTVALARRYLDGSC